MRQVLCHLNNYAETNSFSTRNEKNWRRKKKKNAGLNCTADTQPCFGNGSELQFSEQGIEPGAFAASRWHGLCAPAEQLVTADWSVKLQTCTVSSLVGPSGGFRMIGVLPICPHAGSNNSL